MSARKRPVAFTPLARQDFDDILLYSLMTWGADQSTRYEARLDRVMLQLGEHPESGALRPDIMPGCRSLRAGQHVVSYSIADESVIILRILHQRRHVTPPMMHPED